MREDIRTVRLFAALLVAMGVFGTVAGSIATHSVPIALGVIAALSGVLLAVFTCVARAKTRPR
ncbi:MULTISPECIES: hypothetical protein [Streptomyces]|uniref:Uncharacterized protein n=1 Tax=Streptomyces koyangensis TaxID=188770 RepID=A0A385DEH6_9ACTN|nr:MULTISPECIES: hypothetical protein [Streptomyces]AXQ56324.1 hypothetical protein D0C37_18170 [Streptomyces koyangensis]PKR46064.1 hypothetical protein CWE27_05660 [Streptomyces sp. EAG2]WTD03684.1 hypothetical protein OH717_14405 [Streptomyces albidoflavus]